LEIIPQPRAELKPDPANPRRHSKKQIKQIADSISVFGFNVPILVDREGNVIAGHGRLLACRELGMDRADWWPARPGSLDYLHTYLIFLQLVLVPGGPGG
jgi:hypothetical protein